MTFVQHDDVIQVVTAYRADQSLNVWILPGSPRSCNHLLYAHTLNSLAKKPSVNRIPIPKQILRCRVPGKRFHNLLTRPLSRRAGSHIEVEYFSTTMAQDHQYEENPESGGRNREEIHGNHAGHVIFQEATPRLGRRFRTAWRHEIGNSSLADLYSKLE